MKTIESYRQRDARMHALMAEDNVDNAQRLAGYYQRLDAWVRGKALQAPLPDSLFRQERVEFAVFCVSVGSVATLTTLTMAMQFGLTAAVGVAALLVVVAMLLTQDY